MKLYHNLAKRIAKKKAERRWFKLQCGRTLKPGDLVSTCRGWNERIKVIEPEWTSYGCRRGSYIFDFSIEMEKGGSCSLVHCCTVPLETREEIIQFWKGWVTPEGIEQMTIWHSGDVEKMKASLTYKIGMACLEGKGAEHFDELGQYLGPWPYTGF